MGGTSDLPHGKEYVLWWDAAWWLHLLLKGLDRASGRRYELTWWDVSELRPVTKDFQTDVD